MGEQTFWEKVKKVNAMLEAQGSNIVQEIDKRKQETKDKYPTTADRDTANVYYGYKSQAIFDAVNEVFGVENWKYSAIVRNDTVNAIAKVKVSFRIGDDWFCKGTQYGGSRVMSGNIPDSKKGAITDGLGKCFSLYGIGTKAYRGELKEVYFKKKIPDKNNGDNKPTKAREGIVHKDNDEKFPEETCEKPPEKQEAKKETKSFKPKNPNAVINAKQKGLLFIKLEQQGLTTTNIKAFLKIKLGIEDTDTDKAINRITMGRFNEVLEYISNFYPIVDGDPDALKPEELSINSDLFDQ